MAVGINVRCSGSASRFRASDRAQDNEGDERERSAHDDHIEALGHAHGWPSSLQRDMD